MRNRLFTLPLIAAVALLTGCPERPSPEAAGHACERFFELGSQEKVAALTRAFQPLNDADQLVQALKKLNTSLKDADAETRAEALVKLKADFQPQSPEAQREQAEKHARRQQLDKLNKQKADDPAYAQALSTCTEGLSRLGTLPQIDCIEQATTTVAVRECRNQR
jgi:hypothetical protein